MVNYGNGKIYKLVNSVAIDGNCYYGSTCNELKSRKYKHKSHYKLWKDRKSNYVTSIKLFEEDYENVKIVLVENYPCNSKHELYARERFYIENNPCLNKYVPGLTRKESVKKYNDKNKKKIKLQNKQYYDKNKKKIKEKKKQYYKKIKEYRKEKIECPICKEYTRRGDIRRHQRSIKCQSKQN